MQYDNFFGEGEGNFWRHFFSFTSCGSQGRLISYVRDKKNRRSERRRRIAFFGKEAEMADKRTAASGSRKRKKKKKKKSGLRPFGLFLVILILFVAAGAGMVYYRYRQDLKTDRSPIVMVDGTDISGMTEEQAFNAIISKYPWSIKVVYDGGEKPIDDLLTPVVMEAVRSAQEEENALIEQERQVDFKTRLSRLSQGAEKATITRDLQALENTEFLAAEVAGELGSELGEPAVSGVMLSYDATSGQFQYADSKAGREVDTYQLSSDIRQALDDGDYTADGGNSGFFEPFLHEVSPLRKFFLASL